DAWRVDVRLSKSDAAVKLPQLPWKIALASGDVSVTRSGLDVRGASGAVGASSYADAAARIEFGKAPRLARASGRGTLQLEQWFPWLRERVPQLEEITALSGGADVSLQQLSLAFDRPAAARYDARIALRQVSASLKSLPAPVIVAGGALQVDPSQLRL